MRCRLLQNFRGPVRIFHTPVLNFRRPPLHIQPRTESFEAGLEICYWHLNVVPESEILEARVEFQTQSSKYSMRGSNSFEDAAGSCAPFNEINLIRSVHENLYPAEALQYS